MAVKLKRVRPNVPHHGHGLLGNPKDMKPLAAGAHLPPRDHSGYDDAKGYQASEHRRMGKIPTGVPPADSRKRAGAEGNSKGSAPGGKGGSGSLASHKATAGRGGPGVIGGSDGHKGRPRTMSESLSSKDFERLGAD